MKAGLTIALLEQISFLTFSWARLKRSAAWLLSSNWPCFEVNVVHYSGWRKYASQCGWRGCRKLGKFASNPVGTNGSALFIISCIVLHEFTFTPCDHGWENNGLWSKFSGGCRHSKGKSGHPDTLNYGDWNGWRCFLRCGRALLIRAFGFNIVSCHSKIWQRFNAEASRRFEDCIALRLANGHKGYRFGSLFSYNWVAWGTKIGMQMSFPWRRNRD